MCVCQVGELRKHCAGVGILVYDKGANIFNFQFLLFALFLLLTVLCLVDDDDDEV